MSKEAFKYMTLPALVTEPLGSMEAVLPVPMERLVRLPLESLEELNQEDRLNPLNHMNEYQRLLYTGGAPLGPIRMEVRREQARAMLIARVGDPYAIVTIDHEGDKIYATFAGRSDGPSLEEFVERSKAIAANMRFLS